MTAPFQSRLTLVLDNIVNCLYAGLIQLVVVENVPVCLSAESTTVSMADIHTLSSSLDKIKLVNVSRALYSI